MTEMKIDPDQLGSSATSIAHSAETFADGLDGLEATVTTGNPWGGDEAGSLFGLAYLEVLNHAMEVLGSHLGQLVEAAEGLGTMAQQTWQSEQENTAMMGRSAAGLEG
jgi:hypothetical protein